MDADVLNPYYHFPWYHPEILIIQQPADRTTIAILYLSLEVGFMQHSIRISADKGLVKRYGYALFGTDRVLTALQCAVLIPHQLHPGNHWFIHLQVIISLFAYYLRFPLCALGMTRLLSRRGRDRVEWMPVRYLWFLIPYYKADKLNIFDILVKTGV